MLKQLILATAATALIAAPASARHRHHRQQYNNDYGYAVPLFGYGKRYGPYRNAGTWPYGWMGGYRYSHSRNGDWEDDDDHHRHWGRYGDDQGEDNDDQGEDEDD